MTQTSRKELLSLQGLISLYEIASYLTVEPFKALTFYNIGKLIESIASAHGTAWLLGTEFTIQSIPDPKVDDLIPQEELTRFTVVIHAIYEACAAINIERSTQYVNHIGSQLHPSHKLTYRS